MTYNGKTLIGGLLRNLKTPIRHRDYINNLLIKCVIDKKTYMFNYDDFGHLIRAFEISDEGMYYGQMYQITNIRSTVWYYKYKWDKTFEKIISCEIKNNSSWSYFTYQYDNYGRISTITNYFNKSNLTTYKKYKYMYDDDNNVIKMSVYDTTKPSETFEYGWI